MEGAEHRIGPRVHELLDDLISVAPFVTLSSGFVEDARTALTELALQGELGFENHGDPSGEPQRRAGAPRGADPPFQIPESWTWDQLGNFTEFSIGRTPSTKNHLYWTTAEDTTYSWVSIGDMPRRGIVTETARAITGAAVEEAYRGNDPVPSGSLLMAFKLSVGKTAILGIDAYHNEAIASFSLPDGAFRDYLLWGLPALTAHGATNPAIKGTTLNSKTIARLWVPLPPSAEEQIAIVESLEWCADLIDEISAMSESVRGASDHVLKLLGEGRALSQSATQTHQPGIPAS